MSALVPAPTEALARRGAKGVQNAGTSESKSKRKIKSKGRSKQAEREATPAATEFPVVGIGASAGGLAAFEHLFAQMPADSDTGIAFVIVQHLDPDHKSILTELVRRCTRMHVFEVTDGISVEPNCTYIIPPNKDLTLAGGHLHLVDRGPRRGVRLPIDFFFR